jgi:murein DD-endopeptidase MepM/ murein hydrolase activator NlpD
MKAVFTLLLLSLSFCCFSQIRVVVYNEKNEKGGFEILATNDEVCPVSVKLELDLTNFSSSNGISPIVVIPAKTKGFKITSLEVINPKVTANFKTKSRYNYGDTNLKDYIDYDYSLPFQKGKPFTVFQGYNGNVTHQNENSLDFTMPIGTEIRAAREGIVVKVVKAFNQSCIEKECAEFNNYIIIYHPDGTFSQYVHLKRGGAVVKEGDIVKQDDLIGYSGNVGRSSGPHLHFMVYIQHIDSMETLKTRFKINDGNKSEFLVERGQYARNY